MSPWVLPCQNQAMSQSSQLYEPLKVNLSWFLLLDSWKKSIYYTAYWAIFIDTLLCVRHCAVFCFHFQSSLRQMKQKVFNSSEHVPKGPWNQNITWPSPLIYNESWNTKNVLLISTVILFSRTKKEKQQLNHCCLQYRASTSVCHRMVLWRIRSSRCFIT